MKQLIAIYKEIEQLLGTAKFAVIIILLFAIALIFGTFQESYHGTDYANRLVYKSAWFIILQILMFLSILLATLARLPYKHRLRGFYTLHLGLLTLFFGSFITYDKGLDGNMTLIPQSETQTLLLNTDQVYLVEKSTGETAELDLPYTSTEKSLDVTWKEFTVEKYLPFAEKKLRWAPSEEPIASAQYQLQNDMFSETINLSLNEKSVFKSSESLGPLNVHLLPPELFACFKAFPNDTLLFWDADKNQCLGTSSKLVSQTSSKSKKITIKDTARGTTFTFAPEMSPLPIINNEPQRQAPWRMFNRGLFENSPHLIYFGNALAFFHKEEKSWKHFELSTDQNSNTWIELPWMGFKTKLLKFETKSYPLHEPHFQIPIQDNNQLIQGKERAVQMRISNEMGEKTFWLYQDQVLNVQLRDRSYDVGLRKKNHVLPYKLRLTEFVLKNDPGTQNAASYESFVTVAEDNKPLSTHHIFMNNPLKYDHLTFYQASYFETEKGQGSVLSVNYDPGRWIKYLGSLLLVFGSIWHFAFIRRKERGNS